jgi:3-hydroxy acid dehydrogenase / malonic semialdehyde reductase
MKTSLAISLNNKSFFCCLLLKMPRRETLKGKTILITGATSGIGRALALELGEAAPDDLKLLLVGRRLERLAQLAKKIRDDSGGVVKVYVYRLDLSHPEEVDGFFDTLPEVFRDVDILVNNA